MTLTPEEALTDWLQEKYGLLPLHVEQLDLINTALAMDSLPEYAIADDNPHVVVVLKNGQKAMLLSQDALLAVKEAFLESATDYEKTGEVLLFLNNTDETLRLTETRIVGRDQVEADDIPVEPGNYVKIQPGSEVQFYPQADFDKKEAIQGALRCGDTAMNAKQKRHHAAAIESNPAVNDMEFVGVFNGTGIRSVMQLGDLPEGITDYVFAMPWDLQMAQPGNHAIAYNAEKFQFYGIDATSLSNPENGYKVVVGEQGRNADKVTKQQVAGIITVEGLEALALLNSGKADELLVPGSGQENDASSALNPNLTA